MPEHEAWNFAVRELWKITVSWWMDERRTPFKPLFSIQEYLTWSSQTPSLLSESQYSGGWGRMILCSRQWPTQWIWDMPSLYSDPPPYFKINSQRIGFKNSVSNSLASPKMFGLITKFHNFTDKESENRVCMTMMLTIESNSRIRPAFDSCMSLSPQIGVSMGILKSVNNTA